MFLPQVALAITASLLGAGLARRISAKRVYLLGLACSTLSMVLGIAVFALAGLGCSALLPLTISFGEEDLTAMAAAMAGGVIAFYQLGYGIAAFGVGPLQNAGVSLSRIFGFTAIIAAVMALLSFFVTRAVHVRGHC
jgi:hypothetical protein